MYISESNDAASFVLISLVNVSRICLIEYFTNFAILIQNLQSYTHENKMSRSYAVYLHEKVRENCDWYCAPQKHALTIQANRIQVIME